jgi:UDP-N-acetylmuramoyl-L-alanyl-D-glutamate--2,6-diaminopimelate ligase
VEIGRLIITDLSSLFPEHAMAAGTDKVTGFAIDNRKVAPGNVFGAFAGARFNGEDYIKDAVAAGAVAIVARPGVDTHGAVHIAGDQPRQIFAQAAARFYRPMPNMVAAVTGTNGKTSTAEMTRQLWHMAGLQSASIGTLGITTSFDHSYTGLTTPDIVTFLANMSGMARQGISHAIFEASSHGLSQYRTEGLPVNIAAFTNFSRDHLDYHGTMEEYFAAKMRLFEEVVADDGHAIIWADDARSHDVQRIAKQRGLNMLTVGEQGADLQLLARSPTTLGQQLVVAYNDKEYAINLPLIGAYQVANALVSAAIAIASGVAADSVFDHVKRLQPVRGRLERAVICASGAPVYVDYAHTPDALESAIAALRPHVSGQLITIFGAGGDRDKGKRPEMGRVASAHSDMMIVTDDNPRGEDPAIIRNEIMQAASGALEIGDRREAIAHAIAAAQKGDIILLAGKGHETGQIIGSGTDERILPFDDVLVARECAV